MDSFEVTLKAAAQPDAFVYIQWTLCALRVYWVGGRAAAARGGEQKGSPADRAPAPSGGARLTGLLARLPMQSPGPSGRLPLQLEQRCWCGKRAAQQSAEQLLAGAPSTVAG